MQALAHCFRIPPAMHLWESGPVHLKQMSLFPLGVTDCHLHHLIDTLTGLQMLDKLLDRAHMLNGKPAPYKNVDVGFEVVHHGDGSGILASVNK